MKEMGSRTQGMPLTLRGKKEFGIQNNCKLMLDFFFLSVGVPSILIRRNATWSHSFTNMENM